MKAWLLKNKVFIGGLILSVASVGYDFIKTGGESVEWLTVGWACFIAAISYAGRNLRGQAASLFSMLTTTFVNTQVQELASDKIKIIALLLQVSIVTGGVFFSTPAKSIGYEHSKTIEKAKKEGEQIQPTPAEPNPPG